MIKPKINFKDCHETYEGDLRKLALILLDDDLKLCEELYDHNFFSIVIENLEEVALKRVIKKLSGNFNVGLTHRNFYLEPDQKLMWNMLNWVNPGCIGKLCDFYEIYSYNLLNWVDNCPFWWLRLTWQFCDSFQPPLPEDDENYKEIIGQWGKEHKISFTFEHKAEKHKNKMKRQINKTTKDENVTKRKRNGRKPKKVEVVQRDESEESSSDTIIYETQLDEHIKLPSMDESPIVSSILKNFENYTEPTSSFIAPDSDRQNVISSFLEDIPKASTSRTESEDFILNLI